MTGRHTTTLALDIEGTLISHASTMVPRPGLFDFLSFCRQHFERIVFLSFVDEERGRQILHTMADQGHMPEWVRTADYFHAEGGRPGAKDLRQLGVDPEQALLVDDQPQVLPREQLHRLVQVPEFKEPFPADDSGLEVARSRIMEKRHRLWICGAEEIDRFSDRQLTHLITITNPGCESKTPSWFRGEQLQFQFGDVVSEQDALNYRTTAASSHQIQQAIVFCRVARQLGGTRLLVSCDYGASRSPALAYVLQADHFGPGREAEALREIIAIRPEAVPNQLVVKLGDQLLARQGTLLDPLLSYYQQIEASL